MKVEMKENVSLEMFFQIEKFLKFVEFQIFCYLKSTNYLKYKQKIKNFFECNKIEWFGEFGVKWKLLLLKYLPCSTSSKHGVNRLSSRNE